MSLELKNVSKVCICFLSLLQVLVFTAHQLTEKNDLKSVITMDRHQIIYGDLVKGADVSEDKECGFAWIKMDVTPTVQTWLFNWMKLCRFESERIKFLSVSVLRRCKNVAQNINTFGLI